jgi:GNAT superfamily N-acetyltransferase
VLPNALWKTLKSLDEDADLLTRVRHTSPCRSASPAGVHQLTAFDSERLLVWWSREGDPVPLKSTWLETASLLLVHDRLLPYLVTAGVFDASCYFRLSHRGDVQPVNLPTGFQFREADGTRDADRIASLINACYSHAHLTEDTVRSWLNHPVYAPGLWVWVIDRVTQAPAALGIAELDPTVPEASLEWIQVLSTYRRQGLGRALVLELLRRASGRVAFTTVSGRAVAGAGPERLYRRCGFGGQDVWHVLRCRVSS